MSEHCNPTAAAVHHSSEEAYGAQSQQLPPESQHWREAPAATGIAGASPWRFNMKPPGAPGSWDQKLPPHLLQQHLHLLPEWQTFQAGFISTLHAWRMGGLAAPPDWNWTHLPPQVLYALQYSRDPNCWPGPWPLPCAAPGPHETPTGCQDASGMQWLAPRVPFQHIASAGDLGSQEHETWASQCAYIPSTAKMDSYSRATNAEGTSEFTETEILAQDISNAVERFLSGEGNDDELEDEEGEYAEEDEHEDCKSYDGFYEEDDEKPTSRAPSVSSETTTAASQLLAGLLAEPAGIDHDHERFYVSVQSVQNQFEEISEPDLVLPMPAQEEVTVLWGELLSKCRGKETSIQLTGLELARTLLNIDDIESQIWEPFFGLPVDRAQARLLVQTDLQTILPQNSGSNKIPGKYPQRLRLQDDYGACYCNKLAAGTPFEWTLVCPCRSSLWLATSASCSRPVYRGIVINQAFKLRMVELRYDDQNAWVYSFGHQTLRYLSDSANVQSLLGEKVWVEQAPVPGQRRLLTLTELSNKQW